MYKLKIICSTLIILLLIQTTVKAFECAYDEECRNIRECDEFQYLLKQEYSKMPNVCGIKRNTEDFCCKIKQTVAVARFDSINEKKCGTYRIPPKIVGGEIANVEQFPWMALLQFKSTVDNRDIRFMCGGSLISQRYVLTAAHCVNVRSYNLTSVRLGEHTISKEEDCDDYEDKDTCSPDKVQDIPVEKIIIHPKYRPIDKFNDIALIRLSRDAEIVDNVGTICLPVDEEQSVIENLEDINESNMTIAGWGQTENELPSDVLLYAGVRYLKHEECVARFNQIRARHASVKIIIQKTHLCAGGHHHVDTCSGDSGSPIIYPARLSGNYRMFQYGVVSAGIDCSISEPFPGIYVRVTSYMDWILKSIGG